MAQRHLLQTSVGQPLPLLPTHVGTLQNTPLANWIGLLAPLLAEVELHFRRAAREEFESLLAEKALAAIEGDKNDQELTVQQAAEILGVRPQTVYEWIKANKLQSSKLFRAVRLKRGDVLSVLQAQTQPDGRRKYARRTTTIPAKIKAKGGVAKW